jgi:hypothetical protein
VAIEISDCMMNKKSLLIDSIGFLISGVLLCLVFYGVIHHIKNQHDPETQVCAQKKATKEESNISKHPSREHVQERIQVRQEITPAEVITSTITEADIAKSGNIGFIDIGLLLIVWPVGIMFNNFSKRISEHVCNSKFFKTS